MRVSFPRAVLNLSELITRIAFPKRPAPFRGIMVAVACTLLAALLRLALQSALKDDLPWVTFWFAAIFAAVLGGTRPAALTIVLSSIAGWTLILLQAPVQEGRDIARWALFLLSGGAASAIVALLRGAARPLQDSAEKQRQLAADRALSERRLVLAQEIAGLGVVDWDIAARQLYISEQAVRNYGLAADAPRRRRSLLERVHPDDRARAVAEGEEALSRPGSFTLEYRIVREDGEVRRLEIAGETLADAQGRPIRLISVNRDVTDERNAEAALRESEQRFRLIADSAPVLMWVSRLGGAREFVNKAYVAFAGMTYEEAIKLDWRGRIHPDDLPRILKEQAAGEASKQPFSLEARYLRTDGEWRSLRSFSQPRWGPDGEHAGFIGVAFDVTEENRARADLERINELLAERVEGALAEKERAEAALAHVQKLEALGRLTGGVAHDFNNLLTVVIGALDMIQRHPEDAHRRKRMAEAAIAAARRGERLTSQLLSFSRKQALRPELCDVATLLGNGEPLLRRAVGEAVRFTLECEPGALLVRIDPGQFEAALLNLVVNARDATPDGGAIRIECAVCEMGSGEAPEIEPGRYVRVRVRDAGSGMTPDVIAHAFEPFFTTKPVGKGTGLGLSQVYGFARQSGGAATVESELGRGSTVTLYLPLAEAEAAPAPKAARKHSGKTPLPHLSVLLVEDDADVAAIAETMLKDLGCKVRRVENAAAALAALGGRTRFDLLFTDVIMPGGVNGVELARRATALRPALAVLLASGYAGEALDETLAETPWPLLRKPYSEAELAQRLETLSAHKAETIPGE